MEKYIDEVFFIERSNGTFCYHRNSRLARSYFITNRERGDCYAYLRTAPTGLVETLGVISSVNKCTAYCETLGLALKFLDEKGKRISRKIFQDQYPEMIAALSNLIKAMRYTKDNQGISISEIVYKSIIDTSPVPFLDGTCFYQFANNHKVIRFSNVELGKCFLIKPTNSSAIIELCVNPYLMEERGFKEIDSSVFYKLLSMIRMMNRSMGLVLSNLDVVQTYKLDDSEEKTTVEEIERLDLIASDCDPRRTYNRKLEEMKRLYKGYVYAVNIVRTHMVKMVLGFNFDNKNDVYLFILLHWTIRIRISEAVINEVENLGERKYVPLFLDCAKHYNDRFDANYVFTKKELYERFCNSDIKLNPITDGDTVIQ